MCPFQPCTASSITIIPHLSGTFASRDRSLLKHNMLLLIFLKLVLTGVRLCDLILNINNNTTLDSLIPMVLNQFSFFVIPYSSPELLEVISNKTI